MVNLGTYSLLSSLKYKHTIKPIHDSNTKLFERQKNSQYTALSYLTEYPIKATAMAKKFRILVSKRYFIEFSIAKGQKKGYFKLFFLKSFTSRKVSVFGVILIRIFPHSD